MPILDATALDLDLEGVALLRSLFEGASRPGRPRTQTFVGARELGREDPIRRPAALVGRNARRVAAVAALAPAT